MSVLTSKRTYLRADVRRRQILDVAKDVFASRGYRSANVADICAAARIGRGTLYQYFDNKQAVLLALMEDLGDRVRRVIKERPTVGSLPAASQAPVPLIRMFCTKRLRELLDAVFVDEPTLRLLLREARGLDGAIDRVIQMIDDLVLQAMVDDLKTAQKAGVVRKTDPLLTARFIIGGIEKMVLSALAQDDPVDLDHIVETVIEIELMGILNDEVRR